MKKRGISLITLVVTIIVIIILAGIIIQALTKKNIIQIAEDAVFKHNLANYKEELENWKQSQSLNELKVIDEKNVNAIDGYGTYNGKTLQDLIPDIKEKDIDKIAVIEGQVKVITPAYTDKQISDMIKDGYVPVANSDELNNIRYNSENTFGKGTKWEGKYTGGVDKKYVQVAEIEMSKYSKDGWTSISQNNGKDKEPTYFSGIYDGNNYDIIGLYINSNINTANLGLPYLGLFSCTDSNAENVTFKNISIAGANIISNYGSYCGVLASSFSSKNGIISNVHVGGNITIQGGTAGGMICRVGTTTKTTKIENCSSNVDIQGNSYYSRMAGFIENLEAFGDADCIIMINNCFSKGNISNGCANGFIGNIDGNIINISNSYVSSNINSGTYGGGSSGFIGNISCQKDVIENCYFKGNVINSCAGFICQLASADNVINNCYVEGDLTNNTTTSTTTGFIESFRSEDSNSKSNISNCYYKGNINSIGETSGFIYENMNPNINQDNKISNCYVISNINTKSSASGFCIMSTSNIDSCYYIGDIKCGSAVGFIVDNENSYATISNSYVKGNIICDYDIDGYATGFIERNAGAISNCSYEGNIKAKKSPAIGGLLIENMGSVSNCHVKGNIDADYIGYVGGIVCMCGGYTNSACGFTNNYYEGNITVGGNEKSVVGGLISESSNVAVSNCYVKGNINATGTVGGIIGGAVNSKIDKNCIINGKIIGTNDVGGLIGGCSSTQITNSYVIANEISGNDNVGGIIGEIIPLNVENENNIVPMYEPEPTQNQRTESKISNCYSVSKINCSSSNVHGITGKAKSNYATDTYWNTDISKILADSNGGMGKTTNQMQDKTTYTDWNFDTIWNIDPNKNGGYPYLKDFESIIN